MLSQLERLSAKVDGRYATDEELQFLSDYVKSFEERLQTYEALKEAEVHIVRQVEGKLKASDPALFHSGGEEITLKWRRDTLRTLRYSAIAMLVNDPDTLKERFLLWFQTIMRAFGAQQGCEATYQVMQEVVKRHLKPAQVEVFYPFLELNRRSLGGKD